MTGSGLLAKRPRLRADLLFSRPLRRGPATVYLIKDRTRGRAFEIAEKEQFLFRRLDGVRSLAEITDEYAAEFGRRLNDDHWVRLLWLLHERGLLSADATESVATPGDARHAAVRWWARRLRWTLHPGLFALLCGIVAAALAVVALQLGSLWPAARPAFTDPTSLVALALLAWIGAALHEFAHALAAVHFGATVKRINLVTLTCQIEDYLYLPRRSQQVMIAAAGGLANGLVLLFLAGVLAVVPDGRTPGLLSAYLLVGAAQTLINFIPLPPLDGYKIASHLLGMLDLAPESRRYLWTAPRRLLLRTAPRYPRPAAIWLGLYGAWWLIAVATVAAVMIYFVGAQLRPVLGGLAYVLPAAIVGLTIAGWLARPRRARPAGAAPSRLLKQDNQ
ncbi:metalloprotease [Micromonospora sp. NPDC093277]|uniref:metalloprotease n=1 Tax=Micromonospora sp. NPDC093277 TaxID=3364291 RepID=UPI003828242B